MPDNREDFKPNIRIREVPSTCKCKWTKYINYYYLSEQDPKCPDHGFQYIATQNTT